MLMTINKISVYYTVFCSIFYTYEEVTQYKSLKYLDCLIVFNNKRIDNQELIYVI